MKTTILITFFTSLTYFCFGQKMLNEITLKNNMLTEIESTSIPDIEKYQKEKFKNSRGKFSTIPIKPNDYSKFYKLKGSDDLVIISPRIDKDLKENWEKTIPAYFELLTRTANNEDRFVEKINSQNVRSVIFFVKNYKNDNKNFILYEDKNKNTTLILTYISNSPDSVKIENMRNIIKGMKIE